jgi:hypothetical protein
MDRSDSADPIWMKSSMVTEEPNFANDRRLRPLPKDTMSKTDIELPNRTSEKRE